MRKNLRTTRVLLWFIIILTIFAVLVNLPNLHFLHIKKEFSFRKGLDLEGGTSITFRADMSGIQPAQREKALNAAKNVIEKRVNLYGVSEPVIQTADVNGDLRIIVELPGVSNVNQAIELVGQTAKLEFREATNATDSAGLLITKPTGLTGADLQDAGDSFDQKTGAPIVLFRIADKSQEKFFETTEKLKGKKMGIFLDRQFISAPVVQSAIRDQGQISGNFTVEETKRLALQLNAGALPVPLISLHPHTVDPTLGISSLQKSLFAGLLGLVIIVVFMSVLYGKLGMLASLALLLYTLLVLSIFKLSTLTPYAITLTLSGIAGFILSIGMAVDANILIFERTKEEIRFGKSKEIALELGFSRAWTSIRDSNVSTLITSIVLYEFGNGVVRGFALVLAIGVLISMFSAIVVTRTLLRMVYK